MRRILVAIDGSETALRAIDFAIKQARYAPAAELHVLNVQPTLSNYTALGGQLTVFALPPTSARRLRPGEDNPLRHPQVRAVQGRRKLRRPGFRRALGPTAD